eukprot:CAMPEP_0170200746 /NCGR_PEP_ID=MMETSP0040_2-20121228/70025_1 /TAXON_ID=641309 /ORGANISM="Lotharella oceanica, Strain CCMP622" /LENGTH=61 /DNA_ID=CAMNT_0010450935 /DNA_START=344 /DNA_END=529 /DNA_ORIENTATION=+
MACSVAFFSNDARHATARGCCIWPSTNATSCFNTALGSRKAVDNAWTASSPPRSRRAKSAL